MEGCEVTGQSEKRPKCYSLYILSAVLGLCTAIFLTFNPTFGRGVFFHSIVGFYGGAVAFGAYIVGRIVIHFKAVQFIGRIFTALAIVLLFVFLSIFSGNMVLEYDIRKAKVFCENLVPLLEAYKEENEQYPASVRKVLPKNQKLPLVLKDGNFVYSCYEGTFSFSFSDPGGFMNGWLYSGKDNTWYEWD